MSQTTSQPASPAQPATPDIQGVWVGRYLLADISTTVLQRGEKIKGLTVVEIAFGDTNKYHIKGIVKPDGTLEAWHHSGHRFVGRLTGENTGEGVLTTRNGTKLMIKGTRVSRKVPNKLP